MESIEKLNFSISSDAKNKETSNLNRKHTVSSSTRTNTTTFREPYHRTTENFRLVWLDSSIDLVNHDDSIDAITKLRKVVSAVEKFTDVDACIDFITDTEDQKIFMIISGAFGQKIVPVVHDIVQIDCCYFFCKHKAGHEEWVKDWPKVKGVYTDIISVCDVLKKDAYPCDQNSISISFIKSTKGISNPNLDQLDQSFMYTQILKEILLGIDFEDDHINQFLMYCREQFIGNSTTLSDVEKLCKEYRNHCPIWWYSCNCFLYSMLNRALRMMELDLIIKMGFFVRDLHNNITGLHFEQYGSNHRSDSAIVYRGQGLSQIDFDQLMKTKGGLISFNSFLSTSCDRQVSLAFAESNHNPPHLTGVLFKITIHPSTASTSFADIRAVSAYQPEEEILFAMHSVFRIGHAEQIDGISCLWQVDLTLTNDTDPQLHALTKRIREETKGSTEWIRLGSLMIALAQYKQAEALNERLLKQTTNERQQGDINYQLGCIKLHTAEYTQAVTFYETSLKIRQKILTSQDPDLADCYSDIGLIYDYTGDYPKALSSHEIALEMYQKTLPPDHPDLATSYINIGSVYSNMSEYSKALSYYEKALEIRQKTLPPDHPHLANSYNNIGNVYFNIGEYSKALSYYEKALEIRQKTLPPDHPDLATSYACHGSVYSNMGEYPKALSCYEKALEIQQKTLPPDHPDLANSYNNIGNVYFNMGEYSKALSYYENALEIRQKTLPPDHPHFGTSYNNIGWIYRNMGDYGNALSYYERASHILQRSLTPNHLHLESVRDCIEFVKTNL